MIKFTNRSVNILNEYYVEHVIFEVLHGSHINILECVFTEGFTVAVKEGGEYLEAISMFDYGNKAQSAGITKESTEAFLTLNLRNPKFEFLNKEHSQWAKDDLAKYELEKE